MHAVIYYLSYQDKIGSDFMIAESSLKYPVADFLTSLEMPLAHIQIEYLHPSFKKRHIDLVRIDRAKEKIENAFEFKIAQPTTRYESEQKRIFNDLISATLLLKIKQLFGSKTVGHFVLFIPNGFQNVHAVSKTFFIKVVVLGGHLTKIFPYFFKISFVFH